MGLRNLSVAVTAAATLFWAAPLQAQDLLSGRAPTRGFEPAPTTCSVNDPPIELLFLNGLDVVGVEAAFLESEARNEGYLAHRRGGRELERSERKQRGSFALDLSLLRLSGSYADFLAGSSVALGAELGLGLPLLGITVTPADRRDRSAEFEEFIHLALFLRHEMTETLSYDFGLRASVAELWECRASDCLPARFVGVYLQPMVSRGRWSAGPRIVAGSIADSDGSTESTFTIAISPLQVRYTLAR